MCYRDGVYAENNNHKTQLDEKHPCLSHNVQP
jgi:hypothetical protein